MKKLFTILCAVVLTFSLSAQTEKGTFLIGLNTGLGYTSTNITDIEGTGSQAWDEVYDEQSSSSFNLNLTDFSALLESVKFGYFVADNFAVGLDLIYTSDGITDDYVGDYNAMGYNDETRTTTTFVIQPAVRYYIPMASGSFFGQLSYGIGSTTYSVELSETTNPDDQITEYSGLGFGVGYSILINDNISIEPLLGYSMLTQTQVDGGSTSTGAVADLVTKQSQLSLSIGVTMSLY